MSKKYAKNLKTKYLKTDKNLNLDSHIETAKMVFYSRIEKMPVVTKVIRDPVHGYLKIDKDILNSIVDNKYFQRLRRIEQTSMRCLYPAARHDRFIHSLGVYHLSCLAIDGLETNIKTHRQNLDKDGLPDIKYRNKISFYFKLAALLHDVGHAPFSHTLENYFGITSMKDISNSQSRYANLINELLLTLKETNISVSDSLSDDIKSVHPASHELLSCIIMISCFIKEIKNLARNRQIRGNVDFEFMIRCIVGATYKLQGTDKEVRYNSYKNCIIHLLNSTIDVDKLDYIARDTQSSGYDNVVVDNQRLLGSLMFTSYTNSQNQTLIEIVFNKSATNIIHDVIMCRNSLYTWIYAHHKVQYEVYLIETAINKIAEKHSDPANWFYTTFSSKAILENLFCDDDIWHILKQNIDIPEVNELLERKLQKKAVWKSFTEFEAHFNANETKLAIGEFSLNEMREQLSHNDEIQKFQLYLKNFPQANDLILKVYSTKLTRINRNNIMIYINSKMYSYDTLFSQLYPNSNLERFFYIYSNKKLENVADLVQYIKEYSAFKNILK